MTTNTNQQNDPIAISFDDDLMSKDARKAIYRGIMRDMLNGPPLQRLFALTLDVNGGWEFFADWAEENPQRFMEKMFDLMLPVITLPAGAAPTPGLPPPGNNLPPILVDPSLQAGPLDREPEPVSEQ